MLSIEDGHTFFIAIALLLVAACAAAAVDEMMVRRDGFSGSLQARTKARSTTSLMPRARASVRTSATVAEMVASAPGQSRARMTRRWREDSFHSKTRRAWDDGPTE